MDAYYQLPMAWTYSKATFNDDLSWNNEWNFVSSIKIPSNTCSFSPYQYNQLYPSNTGYLLNQAEPISSLPDQHSLNKITSFALDRRDSCYNPTDAWITSNITNAGYSADSAFTHPVSTTNTMQGICAASPSPTSQSFSSDHGFWSAQSPSSDRSLPSDDTPSPLSDDTGSPPTQPCSVPESSRTCYDHGCDGRVFSSRSNFLRHQRERTPNARLLACPMCGATFYRVWARDYYVKSGRCQK